MTFAPADERAHSPGEPSWWWETWHLDAATDDGVGVAVRLGCAPALGVAWWWTYLLLPELDGSIVVRDHEVGLPRQGLEMRADGLWAELWCESPLEHWTYGLEAFGVRLDDPADSLHGEIGERMPVGLDIEWEAEPGVGPSASSAGAIDGWPTVRAVRRRARRGAARTDPTGARRGRAAVTHVGRDPRSDHDRMDLDQRQLASIIARARAINGLVLLLAPGLAGRLIFGKAGSNPVVRGHRCAIGTACATSCSASARSTTLKEHTMDVEMGRHGRGRRHGRRCRAHLHARQSVRGARLTVGRGRGRSATVGYVLSRGACRCT